MGRRGLQYLLSALGAIAVVAGMAQVLGGAALTPDPGNFSPNLDSEVRFFSVWYVLIGVLLFKASKDVESQGWIVRAVMVTLFVAGCTRILSWATVGKPDTRFVILMVIELVLPLIVLPWQMSVERGGEAKS